MKVLILGVSGMIGHKIWLELSQKTSFQLYGLMRKPKQAFFDYKIFDDKNIFDEVDVSNWLSVDKLLNEIIPDVVINAVGITIRKTEINDFNQALAINSLFPRRLLKWCQSNSSRLIHLSTDCVFSGELGNYTETSQPSAQDNYGKSKFLGEVEGDSALTLRFSCIGQELDSHSELLDWFLSQKGKQIKGYSKAQYSGVTTNIIAKEIFRIITMYPELNGVYQISTGSISKYDLLCLAKEYFKIDVEIEKFDNYVSDKTLLNDKYVRVTGFIPPTWRSMMEEMILDKRINYKLR